MSCRTARLRHPGSQAREPDLPSPRYHATLLRAHHHDGLDRALGNRDLAGLSKLALHAHRLHPGVLHGVLGDGVEMSTLRRVIALLDLGELLDVIGTHGRWRTASMEVMRKVSVAQHEKRHAENRSDDSPQPPRRTHHDAHGVCGAYLPGHAPLWPPAALGTGCSLWVQHRRACLRCPWGRCGPGHCETRAASSARKAAGRSGTHGYAVRR